MYHDPAFCKVIQIDCKTAVEYWHKAYNNSIYNHPDFLNELSHDTHWWLGIRKNKPLILWPVCLNNDNKPIILKDLFFVGPIWLDDISKQPSYKWLNQYRELAALFIAEFVNNYQGFCFDLPFGMMDVRPFLPINIELPDSIKVEIQVRYTTRINDLDKRSVDDILDKMKLDRRQKIRQFDRKSTLKMTDEYNDEEAMALYMQFIESKKFENAAIKIAYFQKVLLLVKKTNGKLVIFRDDTTQLPISCSVLFIHNGVCNLMFQMYSPEFRRSGGTPWVMNALILYAKSLGCNAFDFNGGNHMDLAHDKHSYGADAFPYFRVVSSTIKTTCNESLDF